jgi:hypothetical protein
MFLDTGLNSRSVVVFFASLAQDIRFYALHMDVDNGLIVDKCGRFSGI